MQKVFFSLFVGVGYLFRSFKHPATWAAIAMIAGYSWWSHQHKESRKIVHQVPPIEFKPLPQAGPASPAAGGVVVPAGVTAVPAESGDPVDPDPEKRPVMSSRDLEVAVGRFHKDNLRLPKDADELIEKKYLVGVPPAPPGKRYLLDLSPIQMRLVSR